MMILWKLNLDNGNDRDDSNELDDPHNEDLERIKKGGNINL